MSRSDPYWSATNAAEVAERVVRDQSLTELPIDPMALARDQGITVLRKPARSPGVSGMLLRRGNTFGIIYAAHIDNIGFQNFSVAHELGHYYLPGHIDAVLSNHEIHESQAGFASGDRYEIEADHFAATLLMPRALFRKAMSTFGDGLAAIEKLAERCRTSLTATAIRYARCTREAVADCPQHRHPYQLLLYVGRPEGRKRLRLDPQGRGNCEEHSHLCVQPEV